MTIIYTGLFIDENEKKKLLAIGKTHLSKIIADPHVTLFFKPGFEKEYRKLWGKKAVVEVVGYANDGKNEGVLVKVKAEDPQLQELFEKEVKVPHITISVAKDGKPVDTAKLDFHPCEPTKLEATFGAFCAGGLILLYTATMPEGGKH